MNPANTIDVPSLVLNLSNGCETAYKQLYFYFSPKIQNTARKMGLSLEDSEELQQEIFLTIWKNRSQLKPELSFNAYLLAILKSMMIKKLQRKARKIAYEKYALGELQEACRDTEDELEYGEMERFSFSVINNLPKAQQEVFLLKTQEHLSAGDIAQRLGISKRTVENHIYSATKRIKAKLLGEHLLTIKSLAVGFLCQILL